MEHRREKRILERNAVFIKSAEELNETNNHGVGITAYTYDLSLGGARLAAPKYFPVGTVLRIVVELERTEQSVQVDGEVKWARPSSEDGIFEMGVEFLHNISQTILSLIRHLYSVGASITTSVSPLSASEPLDPESRPASALHELNEPSNGKSVAVPANPASTKAKNRKRHKGAVMGASSPAEGPSPRP
jgi:hypothetical protein